MTPCDVACFQFDHSRIGLMISQYNGHHKFLTWCGEIAKKKPLGEGLVVVPIKLVDTLIPLLACVMVVRSRGGRGKDLDVRNNLLVSYFLTLKGNGTGTEYGLNQGFSQQNDSSVNET